MTRPAAGGAGHALLQGTVPFLRRVPWRLLLPRGKGGPAPLLVALHGKGDRADRFEADALLALPRGWALLVPSAPLARDKAGGGDRAVGDAWYLYDGDTPRFRESLDRAEAHLLGLLARVLAEDPPPGCRAPDPGRVALLGFSQGGYLGGVVAVRHPEVFRAAVLAGARLKHEMLGEELRAARGAGFSLLGLHGREDASVPPGPSERSVAAARAAGVDASFRLLPGGHAFTPAMGAAARAWLARALRESRRGAAPAGRAPREGRKRD